MSDRPQQPAPREPDAGTIIPEFNTNLQAVADEQLAEQSEKVPCALGSDPQARQEPKYDMNIHTNPDARAWARFFMETKAKTPTIADDEECMAGWFANAMMAMHDHMEGKRQRDLRTNDALADGARGASPETPMPSTAAMEGPQPSGESDTPESEAPATDGQKCTLLEQRPSTCEAERNAALIPICVGQPLIQILAKEGQWVGSKGKGLIAADCLFRKDPYEALASARQRIAELTNALRKQHQWHLDQTERSPVCFGDTIGQINADEYQDSELCEITHAALADGTPSTPAQGENL